MMSQPEKLLQLRAKTDRQLLDFVYSKIELGLYFAAAEASLECGERALREAQELLSVMNESQRRELAPKVSELRDALQRLRRESPPVLAASGF
jgi:hypothetical protein